MEVNNAVASERSIFSENQRCKSCRSESVCISIFWDWMRVVAEN